MGDPVSHLLMRLCVTGSQTLSAVCIEVTPPDGGVVAVAAARDGASHVASYTPTARGAHTVVALVRGRALPGPPIRVTARDPLTLPGTTILDDAMTATLRAMMATVPGHPALACTLLTTSARGTTTDVFANAVRGVGPTLTLIRSTAGYVFGAYVHETLCTGARYGTSVPASPHTFLFALGNMTAQPLKLLYDGSGNGVYPGGDSGLYLGSGNDLLAFCGHSCTPGTFKTVAPGYACAALQPGTLCGTPGTKDYTPAMMEVYGVRRA